MNSTFENPVDRENHIVHGVKVLGFTSANGRIYDFDAVKEAIAKYEKAPVNKDHNMEEPSFSDRLGWLENVTLQKDGLYADFHYNPHAEGIESFLWFAEHNGLGDVGFSHLVSGKYSVDPDGTERITRIDKVKSVDLVANPATTKTIFESEMKPMKKKLKEAEEERKYKIGGTLKNKQGSHEHESVNISGKNANDATTKAKNHWKKLGYIVLDTHIVRSYNSWEDPEDLLEAEDDKPMKKKVEEGVASHAELARLAHEAYVSATRQGNGVMAAHYLSRYNKHKKLIGKDKDMKESDSDFKVVTKLSGTNDDQVSKREKTYDLYYKGKYLGTVDDIAKVWKIEKEYANKKGSESMKEDDYDDLGLTDKEKADNLRAAKLQDRKMAASRRKNSGDDDGRRGYGPTGTTRTNRARRRESVKEAKQPSQGSEMTVKQLADLFKDGEWEAYSDVVPNKHVTLFNKSKNKKVNVLVREQGDDEMDKEKLMEEENPMQQEEVEQEPMMEEADDVYAKIKEICEGEGSDEEKSKQVLEMLGLSGGMSEGEGEPMEEAEEDPETKDGSESAVLEVDDEEDDEDKPKKESKSELASLRKWKAEKLKEEKIVNLIKESNLEPTKVFIKQLSAIDSKLWSEAIRDRKKVALVKSSVKPISSGSQSRSESSYKQFLESVLGK